MPRYRLYNCRVDRASNGYDLIPVKNVTAAEIGLLTALHSDGVKDPIDSIEDTGKDLEISTLELYQTFLAKYRANLSIVERELGAIVKSRGTFVERIEGVPHRDAEPLIEEFNAQDVAASKAKKV